MNTQALIHLPTDQIHLQIIRISVHHTAGNATIQQGAIHKQQFRNELVASAQTIYAAMLVPIAHVPGIKGMQVHLWKAGVKQHLHNT